MSSSFPSFLELQGLEPRCCPTATEANKPPINHTITLLYLVGSLFIHLHLAQFPEEEISSANKYLSAPPNSMCLLVAFWFIKTFKNQLFVRCSAGNHSIYHPHQAAYCPHWPPTKLPERPPSGLVRHQKQWTLRASLARHHDMTNRSSTSARQASLKWFLVFPLVEQ